MTPHDIRTRDWLVEELSRGQVVERSRLEPVAGKLSAQNPYSDAKALAVELVRGGLLTPFQADKALEGDVRSLVLGPYVLVDVIGNGGMGTVYRAVGRADRQNYAVRVLPQRSAWNVRLARRQVRAFAELPPAPSVVPFLDVGTAGGRHYLVWPLVEGAPLGGLVEKHGKMPPPLAARVALRVAEGLHVCERAGLFHGLLKPSNIVIAADQSVKVLDFGLGALLVENADESLLDTLSTAAATHGMIDFTAPEIAFDPAARGPTGDQYSLGCVLYYALTGAVPFPEGSTVQKMMAHQSQKPRPVRERNPQVPDALAGVIDHLLQKSPRARFADAGELADTLRLIVPPDSAVVTRSASPAARFLPGGSVGPAVPPPPPLNPATPIRPAAVSKPPSTVSLLPAPPPVVAPAPPLPPEPFTVWLGRLLAFGGPRRDRLTCSVYAPAAVRPGDTFAVIVAPHPPAAASTAATAATLAAGTDGPARLAGTGAMARPVPVGAHLEIHVGLDGLGVDKPLRSMVWRGGPEALRFAVFVPWETSAGPRKAVLSVGLNDQLIARVEWPLAIVAAAAATR
jgi:serine/threonine protein kinase